MKRRRAREMALQVLFQSPFFEDINATELHKQFIANFEFSEEVNQTCLTFVDGVLKSQKEIDAKINSASHNWSTDRMSLTDLIIMRLALFELLFSSDREKLEVVANESVELAKKYSSKESASFINGILDSIWHQEAKEHGS